MNFHGELVGALVGGTAGNMENKISLITQLNWGLAGPVKIRKVVGEGRDYYGRQKKNKKYF